MESLKKEYYTPKELAQLTDLTTDGIRQKIRAGKLKATFINRGYLIDKEEAERFISERAGRG